MSFEFNYKPDWKSMIAGGILVIVGITIALVYFNLTFAVIN